MKNSGKVVAITGAARGIGKACAARFLSDGARVVISDVDAAGLVHTAQELGHIDQLRAVEADVSKRADVDRIVATAVKEFGRLDVMVNNAGVARNRDFLDISEAEFDDVMGINLKGAFFGVQAAARQMIAQGGGGVVVNMSSVNALLAIPSLATYAMSKGAMKQLTSVAAVALASHGIRVVAVGPGTILTEMVATAIFSSEDARRSVLSRTPAGRCGEPSEVAAVVAFLASDDASYITGQTIYPDGGRLILNYTVPVSEKK
ncbi:glucose 1-dehydrogenase [Bradyrhizobium sp. USDA 4524]|uniref:SDR family NAD(P)-dependent oxidoreductase n=1 Tax=unclassified Bradyrhizobium TaxID=2631580 RepID=UPI00209CBF53|nr:MULTISPECIES: SDR family oxidoreductase [unclassified Bradyrhizobium]MCP1841956.1 NAD(P)-dependent dehydrogenase (short-subunit alcohol dehydrogenase family) [Bradyrhizobium sp. USDA 4538]MCP1902520.1 NAD(P)-dependent dehydrogenase (short-subunit alcohol dehydrogenase family) [Bradyrhizobium sp. USDA 4537]MCP1991823.1 NAD(P)-dependent dehydrogenase (short-subunit alcohol dehydrogenase family) [Bradyrhizobium sp. USDA 4539]